MSDAGALVLSIKDTGTSTQTERRHGRRHDNSTPARVLGGRNGDQVVDRIADDLVAWLEAHKDWPTCVLDVADEGSITLEEVGEILGVSRERVRQIEARALFRLRASGEAELALELALELDKEPAWPEGD